MIEEGTARALVGGRGVDHVNEGHRRLARRLVHQVLAVVLELHSRRESVWGLRTGVSAISDQGPHTDVRDEGAVLPGSSSPYDGSAGGGVGRRPKVACRWWKSRGAGPEGAPATFTCHSGQWGLTVQSLMAAQASGALPLGCR